MSLIYDLKLFEKELYKPITISVEYFIKDFNSWKTEYIQGELKKVDIENQTIEIEQHFTYVDYLLKNKTETKLRSFKNRQFFMIECGNFKASK